MRLIVTLNKSDYLGWLRAKLTDFGLIATDFGIHSLHHGALLDEDHISKAIMGYAQIPPDRQMSFSAKVNKSLAKF